LSQSSCLFVLFSVQNIQKKSLGSGLATRGILFNVNYVTLNRQSNSVICLVFSPKAVLV
jgi:hypothetical protein